MNMEEVDARTILEIREILRQTRNRDAVVRLMQNRGMEETDAHELVYSIHRANLSANRKGALYKMIGSGTMLAVTLLILSVTHRTLGANRINAALVIMAAISAGGFLWGLSGFIMANGYEVDPD
jgi:putative exporter of polyketide antibiotics